MTHPRPQLKIKITERADNPTGTGVDARSVSRDRETPMSLSGDTTLTGPYATAARLYRAAGWPGVLPIGNGPNEKWPPPGNRARGITWTGHGAPEPAAADIEAWIQTHGDRNIGLRAPAGVLGLDVDAYEKDGKLKGGAEALAQLVTQYGPLPPTWVSGARPAPSGIYWFRVPLELDGREINWPGEAAKGIELIQHGHRYAVVWPSTNPEADGARYRWRHTTGIGLDSDHQVPDPTHFAELPDAWVRGLALPYERAAKTTLGRTEMATWWGLLRSGPACGRVADALASAARTLRDGRSGRHETARDAARTIAAYGGEGHLGVPEALAQLAGEFATAVGRGRVAVGVRLRAGAAELAAADNPAPRQLCACNPPALLATVPPTLPPGAVVPAPKPDEPLSPDSLTDSRIAQLLSDELLRGRHCWAPGLGWLAWDGARWREVSDKSVVEHVRLWVAQYVAGQVANVFVRADREAFRLLLGLESAYRLKAVTDLCAGVLHVEADAFDAHPELLNTPTGVVDLRTAALTPHDAALRITRMAGVGYAPGATHEDWAAALEAVRPDVADWLQVRLGQALTGHMTPDDLVLLLQGGGENGKSTVLNAVKAVLGTYGTYISDRVLLAQQGDHPTEMMDFRGARFAMTEELPDERHLNTKRLKDVAGTPTIKARRMRQDTVEFAATHSFFVSTNYVPVVTDTDHGTWRRLALVKFPYRYRKADEALEGPEDRRGDPTLRDRLKSGEAQRQAVLAWLVEGARRWYESGMPPVPASVRADTGDWRARSDSIEGFWRDRLRPDPNGFVTSVDMLAEFNAYLASVGQREWSDRRFNPVFSDHSTTRRYGVAYAAIRVKSHHVRSYRRGSGQTLSPFIPEPTAVGTKIRAWWGVRFVTHNDAELGVEQLEQGSL